MATLYIRDVCDQVVGTLKERAAAQGQSLSAYVSAQLATLAERPTNAEIVERLRSSNRQQGVPVQQILDELEAGRR